MKRSKDQLSACALLSDKGRLSAKRAVRLFTVCLFVLAAAACNSGKQENRADQNSAPAANGNQADSTGQANSTPETPQSPSAANENRLAPIPPPAAPVASPDSNELPSSSSAETRIAGTWQSPVGRVAIRQSGSSVSGTAYYLDGSGTGAITGKLEGRNLSFQWTDKSGRGFSGAGKATVSPDGRSINGIIQRSDGKAQPFAMNR